MDFISRLRVFFSPPSAAVLTVRQLEDTRRYLLRAYPYREEAEATVQMYEARLKRLEAAGRGEKK